MVNTTHASPTSGGVLKNAANTRAPPPPLWMVLASAAESLESDPEAAETQANEILKAIPTQQHALMLLVSAHKTRGNVTGARAILESMSAEYPDVASVHHELGVLLLEIGEAEATIGALSRVVELEPQHPTAWRLLAEAFADRGEADAAANAYLKHFESSVMDLRMLERAVALDAEQAETTEKMLREFLTIHPTDVAGAHMLGRLCRRLDLVEDAERLFTRVMDLAPDYASGVADYLDLLQTQSKWEKELEVLNRILEKSPDDPGYRFRKAVVLSWLGEHGDALRLYEELVGAYPAESRCWSGLANELRTLGRQEDSVAAQRMSIEIDAGHGQGWWGLATLKTYRFSSAEIDVMRTQIRRGDLAEGPRYYLEFALGEALEREEKFSESFEHYLKANALRRAQLPYDAEETTAKVRRIKKQYTSDFFRRHAGMGSPSGAPIFIIGLPRSGSTLVEQILSCHSAIEGAGELPCLAPVARGCKAVECAGETDEDDANAPLTFEASVLQAAGERYLESSIGFRKLSRPFFTDKTPGNFHHLGLICAMLPNARIIDVRRHPLACSFSNFRQLFPSGLPQTCSLTDIGRYYHDYVDMMAHFDEVLPDRIYRVFYENLVSDPERQIRGLLAYCGLPFEQACLHSHRSERAILTISSEQVRQPLYLGANEQWRNYETWLDPLKAALGPVLEAYPAVPHGLGR